MKKEKWVYVVSKYDSLDLRMYTVGGQFETAAEAEAFWWETVQKQADLVRLGYSYYVESLRVA